MHRTAARGGSAVLGAVLLMALTAAFPARADADEPPAATRVVELDRRAGEGEQCIVCGRRVHGDEIVEVRYKGRSFYVAAKMLDDLTGDPDTYFQQLQARSALFDERSMEGRRMSMPWLLFGVYVLAGLVGAAFCGYLAVSRGLSPMRWFFAGLVGNLAAVAVILVAPRGDVADVPAGLAKVPTTHRPLPCPRCGAPNHPAAAVCSSCGAGLSPAFESEAARA